MAIAALCVSGAVYAQTQNVPAIINDESLLRSWIQTISSDDFGGRKPMTEYEEKTVSYLAGELEALGLEPAFGGSWYQPFEMIAVTAKPDGGCFVVKGKKLNMYSAGSVSMLLNMGGMIMTE